MPWYFSCKSLWFCGLVQIHPQDVVVFILNTATESGWLSPWDPPLQWGKVRKRIYRPATHPIHFAADSPDKIIAALRGRYFLQIEPYVVVQISEFLFIVVSCTTSKCYSCAWKKQDVVSALCPAFFIPNLESFISRLNVISCHDLTLSVAAFKMNTTTSCGWLQANPQKQRDLWQRISRIERCIKIIWKKLLRQSGDSRTYRRLLELFFLFTAAMIAIGGLWLVRAEKGFHNLLQRIMSSTLPASSKDDLMGV